ncbi:MAG: Uma2 family endonuclease [Chitinophagales bacterium]
MLKTEEKLYTVEEYLALEEKPDAKSEFYNGIIWAMSRGTLNHATISSNVNYALHNELST